MPPSDAKSRLDAVPQGDVSPGRAETPESRHLHETMARLDKLERLFDRRYGILGIRFGWDSILGLIPGVGDGLSAAVSSWLIWKAHRLGAPNGLKAKMAANAALDFGIGSVPLVGDVTDVFYRANTKNIRLLKQHLAERHRL